MEKEHCPGILVVEDDPAIREVLKHLLEAEGHRVTALANGHDAVAHLETHEPPCFVLLDLMMPVMDGWQFLKIREKSPRLLAIPVVVMSASLDQPADDRNTTQMRKPFELETVVRMITRYCKPHAPLSLKYRAG